MMSLSTKNLILTVLLVGCASSASSKKGAKGEIIFITSQYTATVGDTAVLNCTVNNPGDEIVAWYRVYAPDTGVYFHDYVISSGNLTLIPHPRMEVKVSNDFKSYLLIISKIETSDAGIYKCAMSLSKGSKESEVQLLVLVPAKITNIVQTPQPAVVGDNVTLSCFVDGYYSPSVSWVREYNAVMPNGGHSYDGNNLTITSVSKEDRGTYYCRASNAGGYDRMKIDFKVNFAPVISTPRPFIAQALLHDIYLECNIEAYPLPNVSWYRYSTLLHNAPSEYSITFAASAGDMTNTALRVHAIQTYQYGNYYCKANNRLGESAARIYFYESDLLVQPWNTSIAS